VPLIGSPAQWEAVTKLLAPGLAVAVRCGTSILVALDGVSASIGATSAPARAAAVIAGAMTGWPLLGLVAMFTAAPVLAAGVAA
jgi:hypothetical protein